MWNIILSQTAMFATVATAIVAYFLYRKQKRDSLEDASRIIVLEIRESEKVIRGLLDFKNENPNPNSAGYPNNLFKIIPNNAWVKYSHLFIKKLSNDEYDQINDYYNKCEILEKYLEKNYNFFWVTTEERAKQNEEIGSKIAMAFPEIDKETFVNKFNEISSMYFSNIPAYVPAGIRTQIDKNLNLILIISNTPVWNKLKSIAKYDDLSN